MMMRMNKRQLYFVVIALAILLIGVLFWPTEPYDDADSVETESSTETKEMPTESEQLEQNGNSATTSTEVSPADYPEQVIIEGVFLSLVDGETRHKKEFKYLLLDDGSEIMRIDLRPLIGYSDIEVIEKLGVNRGQRVQVTGVLEDGEFNVRSITPLVIQ